MRAAYVALDERTKAEVVDLIREHSLIYSREAIGFVDLTPEEIVGSGAQGRIGHEHRRREPLAGSRDLQRPLQHEIEQERIVVV